MDLTYLTPPIEDNINVKALVADTASSAFEVWSGQASGHLVTFVMDADGFITFGDSSVTDPDGTATSGSGRTWSMKAGVEKSWHLSKEETPYFKAISAEATYVRWYVEKRP